jgi:hypothetical protein
MHRLAASDSLPSPGFLRRRTTYALMLLAAALLVAPLGRRGLGTPPSSDQPTRESLLADLDPAEWLPDAGLVARSGPRRFVDSLFGRDRGEPSHQPQPHRAFIPAPEPDPPSEDERATVSRQERSSGDWGDMPAVAATNPAAVPEKGDAGASDERLRDGDPAGDDKDADGFVWGRGGWNEMKRLAVSVADSAKRVIGSGDMGDADATPQPDGEDREADETTTASASSVTSAGQVSTKITITDRPETDESPENSGPTSSASRRRQPLPPPSAEPPPKTREFALLKRQVERTLGLYKQRPLNTADNTPWEVMHGFIAFGIPTQVRVGGPRGSAVNAIGWMNMGGRCRGQVMLVPAGDLPTGLIGYGVQGHLAQYLAILAQCRVAKESPIRLQKRDYTVADLVEQEKRSCRSGKELTFSLIALSHYLPPDEVWENWEGETWTLERLMEEELAQPIRSAACGGTHRLFGLSYGCYRRQTATGSLDGVFKRADKFVREYQNFALTQLQNRDGSFSTEWFKYPADREDDIDRKIQTTGHILEWLVASVDQPMLYHPRIVQATRFLSSALASEPDREWKIGPLGHALHALTVYQERVWGTVHEGNIAAFHGTMKAVPNDPVPLLADEELLESTLLR